MSKRARQLLVWVVCLGVLASGGILVRYAFDLQFDTSASARLAGDPKLPDKLASAVRRAADDRRKLELASIARFEWDRFYAFPPGTDATTIGRSLGFRWRSTLTSRLQDPRFCLLVFADGRRVVQALLFEREVADFARLAVPRSARPGTGYASILRDSAVFAFGRARGRPVVRLAPSD